MYICICKLMADISGRGKRRESSRDGGQTKDQSAVQIDHEHTSDRAAVTGGTVAVRLKSLRSLPL